MQLLDRSVLVWAGLVWAGLVWAGLVWAVVGRVDGVGAASAVLVGWGTFRPPTADRGSGALPRRTGHRPPLQASALPTTAWRADAACWRALTSRCAVRADPPPRLRPKRAAALPPARRPTRLRSAASRRSRRPTASTAACRPSAGATAPRPVPPVSCAPRHPRARFATRAGSESLLALSHDLVRLRLASAGDARDDKPLVLAVAGDAAAHDQAVCLLGDRKQVGRPVRPPLLPDVRHHVVASVELRQLLARIDRREDVARIRVRFGRIVAARHIVEQRGLREFEQLHVVRLRVLIAGGEERGLDGPRLDARALGLD
eukprot:2121837-Prymnesium_polylepis.1